MIRVINDLINLNYLNIFYKIKIYSINNSLTLNYNYKYFIKI